jgi:hypothetical protein
MLPPYPTNLDYYTDDLSLLVLTVINTDMVNPHMYRLEADIMGPRGITANIRYLGSTTIIQPGESQMYNGTELRELGMSSDGIEHTDNLTEEQQLAITINHALPEGDYTICFKAYDDLGVLISDPSTGCSDFTIQYVDRPEVIVPTMHEYVFPVVTPVWIHDVSGMPIWQRERLIYRMTIGDATLDHLVPHLDEIYDLNTSSMRRFETPLTVHPLFDGEDYDFIEGHQYVVWVTAIDPEGETMFLDRGNSNVIVFTYGEPPGETEEEDPFNGCITEETESTFSCDAPQAELFFPSHQDTLPYNKLPFILRFDPYCPDYRRLEYSFQLHSLPSGTSLTSRSDVLTWPPGGPLQYLLDQGITNATEDEARMFMLNDNTTTPLFERSKSYRATSVADMEMRSGSAFH